jgi:NADH-quinone oxidoreductase subunit A
MPNDYLPIAVLVTLASLLAILVTVIGTVFGPRNPTRRKMDPYESGMRTLGPSVRRMPVRFYLIAVLFILFDIEVVFFLPWAVTFQQLGMYGFAQMLVFIGILLVGYIWAWKKGAFEWE